MFPRLTSRIFVCLVAGFLVWSNACLAGTRELNGNWYQTPASWIYQGQADLATASLEPVTKVAPTGGHFWLQAEFDIDAPGRYVLDFKNTSIIGHFRHIFFDAQNRPVADEQGGIQSTEPNPFFLRHGREVELAAGHYRLLTELDSPFFLAEPRPYLESLATYRQEIKPGNALTLLCLGVFVGLMIYYATLAFVRRRLTEAMYATFILGNLLFNGAALLVFSDLLGLHWIYLAGCSVLFSNVAYVLFVMHLLDIRQDTHPRLHKTGLALLALLAGLIALAAAMPHWSLELSRYGVALFLTYGLTTGIVRTREGCVSAYYYLYAIAAFFVMGITTITTSNLTGLTLHIEHMGLMSVAVEIMLLALVLSYQFAQLYGDKEHALVLLEQSTRVAQTDSLTGLPNRVALDPVMKALPPQGCLTFIDLDGLKYYNDQFGHERGDELLCAFARHLQDRLGVRAQAHRLGGDEFAVTCEDGDETWVDNALAQAVGDMCADGFAFAGASHGTVHVRENHSKEELMRMADHRMYENKRQRKLQRYSGQKNQEISQSS